MDKTSLETKLAELRSLPTETECVEFKEANTGFHFDKLGQYFSALSNEANLKNQECGWLVLGVRDKDREIVGTWYRSNRTDLEKLKSEIANHATHRITFQEIHELEVSGKRVIMFQIPAAPPGIPTAWKGHFYGREGDSLNALSLEEIERIRSQRKQADWSAQICDNATIDDLDSEAIAKARAEYGKKNSKLSEEISGWDDITFLNKAKLTIQGRITRAAIILLGKETSEHFISPSVANTTAPHDYELS